MDAAAIREAAERGGAASEVEEQEVEPIEEPEVEPAPDPDEELEEEADEQPPPDGEPVGMTEAQVDAIFKGLEREGTRHAREVEKRAGPMFADLVPCACCGGEGGIAGFMFPVLPEPEQTFRRQAVLEALGGTAEAEYPQDDERETCEKCGGLGKLTTGSKVPEQVALPCRYCAGQGWKQKLAQVPAPPVAVMPPVVPPPTPQQPTAAGIADAWGRPAGHPHYGLSPAQVGA